jgi:tRNA threonylcarbamoyladenosine biosynthesis protein TsaB
MGYILCIESGTNTCSVALGQGQELIDIMESHEPNNNHAKNLTAFIKELLDRNSLKAAMLSAIAICKGPGSYTGLRIGVSAAKGICYGASIPLIAIGSLNAMAWGAIEWLSQNSNETRPDLLCPMIDARRMEVYTQLFDMQGNCITEVEAKILDENSFDNILMEKKILFFGNGSDKISSVINHPNATFIKGFLPSARFMLAFASENLNKCHFEDVAYFEPFYLKDFVATVAKNKVLGNS